MNILDIAQITGAVIVQRADEDTPVTQLAFDSRQRHSTGALFFALPGPRHDGHQYCADAWQKGIRHFVISDISIIDRLPDSDILLVTNTLSALQTLAAYHRRNYHLPVIAITGSNGKTIVKEWLYQLLRVDYDIVRSPQSFNSQIGVPVSVWQIQMSHTLGIFEAGISTTGEMAALEQIIRPDIGIFTNIGPAHSEGFENDAAKVAEKMRLFSHCKTLIFSSDYPLVEAAARQWYAEKPTERRLITISKQYGFPLPEAILRGPAFGIENAFFCIALMRHLGYSDTQISHRLMQVEPVEMRMETKLGIQGCTVINDAYNNDLTALRFAMQHVVSVQPLPERRMLILSDILQTGMSPNNLYQQVAQWLLDYRFGTLIGIGTEIRVIRNFLPADFAASFFEHTDDLLGNIPQINWAGRTVLLKGARVFAFERIASRLEEKIHKTHLEINLSALIHNLNVYAALLKPGTRMLVMVKAAAYGGGAAEIARMLEFHRVDYLGVAYADEGIELRNAGINLPILVLNPEPASFDAMYRFRLEPEVYSLDVLRELANFAQNGQKSLTIHVKLDTGMHRLGFEEADIPQLINLLSEHDKLRIGTVFTHLSASDAPQHDAFTHQQAARFAYLYEQLCTGIDYRPVRHIVNTGGIARFPEYHHEMVRLGIGLYGIDGSGLQSKLRVVNTLKATISQVKVVPPGDTVGYNRNSGILDTERRIATISIGYADGYLRLAGGGRHKVLVRNQLAPTIGNVCMDMTMIDITHIPDAKAGDEVIIFGENPPVQDLAQTCQTIPYEIFTGISERVKRIYVRE